MYAIRSYYGIDNDGDGKVDCNDPDCTLDPACGGYVYGAPMEDCANEVDDDRNNFV